MQRQITEHHLKQENTKNNQQLIKQLKILNLVLAQTEQLRDNKAPRWLRSVMHDLVQPRIRDHRTKDVRLLCSCCLAEVFRIKANDKGTAPYSKQDVKKIFKLFISQLRRFLGKPEASSFDRIKSILDAFVLSDSQNILVRYAEEDGDETLLIELCEVLLESACDEHSAAVTDLIAEVLIVSLAEFKRDLPPTLLETMLKPLLETVDEPDDDDEAVFSSKFLIASRVCRAPRLQIALEEYFYLLASAHSPDKEENSDARETCRLWKHMEALILQLHTTSKNVLQKALPVFCSHLKNAKPKVRQDTAALLGRIFASGQKTVDYSKAFPICFNQWLSRFEDCDQGVRQQMLEAAVNIIEEDVDSSTHATLETKILARGMDPSLKVRRLFVRQVCDLAIALVDQTAKKFVKIISKLLQGVGDRVLDKFLEIRMESITGLTTVYKTFVSSQWKRGDESDNAVLSESDNTVLSEALAWIPSKILTAFGFPEPAIKVRSLLLLDEHLLPRELDSSQRAHGMITLWKGFGRCSRIAFERLQQTRAKVQKIVQNYVDDRENDLNLRRVKSIIQAKPGTARSLMSKAFEDHIHSSKDKKVFELLAKLADPLTSAKVLRKSRKELQQRVGFKHPKTGKKTPQALFIAELAQFCGMLTFEVDTVSDLLEIANDSDMSACDAEAAAAILVIAAENFPSAFTDHVESVLKMIAEPADELRLPASRIFSHVAKFFKYSSLENQTSELFSSCLDDMPAVAKNIAQGLFSAHLAHTAEDDDHAKVVTDLIQEIVSHSLSIQNRNLAAALSAMVASAKVAPRQLLLVWEEVYEFIIRNIFLSADTPKLHKDPEVTINALKALVGSITVFCNSMEERRVHIPEDDERIERCTTLLCTLCSKPVSEIGATVKITAFDSLLKMGLFLSYTAKQHCCIAFALIDNDQDFRTNALTKLTKRMMYVPGQPPLPNNYLSLFILFAGDTQLGASAATKLRSLLLQRRKMYRDWINKRNPDSENQIAGPFLVEIALAHAIHILAHHPRVEGKSLSNLHKNKKDGQANKKLKAFLEEKLMFLLKPMIKSTKDPDATLPWILGILKAIRESNDIMEARHEDTALAKTYILSYLAEHFVENKVIQNKGYDSYAVRLPGRLFITKTKQQQEQTNNSKSWALQSFLSPIAKKKASPPATRKSIAGVSSVKKKVKQNKSAKSRTPSRRSSRKSSPINYKDLSGSDMEEEEDGDHNTAKAQAKPSGLRQSDAQAQAEDQSSVQSAERSDESDDTGGDSANDERKNAKQKSPAPRASKSASKRKSRSARMSGSPRPRSRASVSPQENKSNNLPSRRSKRKSQQSQVAGTTTSPKRSRPNRQSTRTEKQSQKLYPAQSVNAVSFRSNRRRRR